MVQEIDTVQAVEKVVHTLQATGKPIEISEKEVEALTKEILEEYSPKIEGNRENLVKILKSIQSMLGEEMIQNIDFSKIKESLVAMSADYWELPNRIFADLSKAISDKPKEQIVIEEYLKRLGLSQIFYGPVQEVCAVSLELNLLLEKIKCSSESKQLSTEDLLESLPTTPKEPPNKETQHALSMRCS
jgi:hypothetical protein